MAEQLLSSSSNIKNVAKHGSSTVKVSFNYINSILGSGIIGIPYAIRQAGLGAGIFLIFLIGWIIDYSLILMIKGGSMSGAKSYQELVYNSLGSVGYYILTALQFIFPLVAMVSYNIIFGDTVTKVIVGIFELPEDSIWNSRELLIFLATIFLTLPISLYRNISRLAKISLISLLLIGFITITIYVQMNFYHKHMNINDAFWVFMKPAGIPEAIGIITFGMMCHHNSFLLYESLDEPSIPKWKSVTHVSIFVSVLCMILLGLGGYFSFGSSVQGDLFNNYCWDDHLINASRTLFCIAIMFTYPIECFVCREVLLTVIFGSTYDVVQNMDSKKSIMYHIGITVLIVTLTYLISLVTNCLGVVLALNGILAAIPLAFIFPAICYLKLNGDNLTKVQKFPSVFLVIFGISVAIIGIAVLISFGPETCDHSFYRDYCSVIHKEIT
ncbi:putative sodium-coupled neutral amino acid transporter 11 isoform X2 [Lepeophtheirus salmonis]|uniref:putative sodium-coupled neutral amino acid transporter 11 isoform X2 n=1 Tax=Lepeophtheirus salmonis TaxID=72036 RepID=UPI001AE63F2F|nr:putative sodium-coupled neutral amino acid transporter 11 isoform X2 [Lepeophtheirus salmonis]